MKRFGLATGIASALMFFSSNVYAQSGEGDENYDDDYGYEDDYDDYDDYDDHDEPPHCMNGNDCDDGFVCVFPEDLGVPDDHEDYDDGMSDYDDGYDDGDYDDGDDAGDAGDDDGGDQAIDDHGDHGDHHGDDSFGEHGYCVPGCSNDNDCHEDELCHVDAGACVPEDVIQDLEEEGFYNHDDALQEKGSDRANDEGGPFAGCEFSAVPSSMFLLIGSLAIGWVRRRRTH